MKKQIVFYSSIIVFIIASASFAMAMDYQHEIKAEDMTFAWTLDASNIHIKLSAKTTGWVGIGFTPDGSMLGANIIIGAVKKGKVRIQDHFGNRNRGHIPDKKQGGTNDISNAEGSEENGITTISFTMPLDSGDKFDLPAIKADGTDKIILAYGAGRDSFKSRHLFRSEYQVNFATGGIK